MMRRILQTLAILFTSSILSVAGENWLSNWDDAKAKSKAENKPILINLTGSDWCPSCIKIKREIFSQEAFKKFADENLILMEVDFPQKKKQSEALKKQNTALEEQYPNEGYPAVFLLDSEGKKLSEDLGSPKGGPDTFVNKLKALIANPKK